MDQGSGLAAAVGAFGTAAGLSQPDESLPLERRLGAVLAEAGAPEAVRAACNGSTDESPTILPHTIGALGAALFPDDEPGHATAAASGLIGALSPAHAAGGSPLLPIRLHVFFGNAECVNEIETAGFRY